jgi:hypothetical protein
VRDRRLERVEAGVLVVSVDRLPVALRTAPHQGPTCLPRSSSPIRAAQRAYVARRFGRRFERRRLTAGRRHMRAGRRPDQEVSVVGSGT